jgi:hypothetical protein
VVVEPPALAPPEDGTSPPVLLPPEPDGEVLELQPAGDKAATAKMPAKTRVEKRFIMESLLCNASPWS